VKEETFQNYGENREGWRQQSFHQTRFEDVNPSVSIHLTARSMNFRNEALKGRGIGRNRNPPRSRDTKTRTRDGQDIKNMRRLWRRTSSRNIGSQNGSNYS